MDVHSIVVAVAHGFGGLVFHQAANDAGLFAIVYHGGRRAPRGLKYISSLNHFGQGLCNAFHLTDG